jgi:hypothetical protein
MRNYAGISFALTEHSSTQHLSDRFASERLLNPADRVDSFYLAKTDNKKIVGLKRGD